MLRQDADLEFQFVCKLVHELRQSQRKAIIVARRDAPGRIAMFVDMLRRTPVNEGRPQDVVEMPMTRSDIGDFLNLAHESVSRACKRLGNMGIIEFKKGTAHILDRARFDKLVARN
jgi:CRP-like cAMP-binding protein